MYICAYDRGLAPVVTRMYVYLLAYTYVHDMTVIFLLSRYEQESQKAGKSSFAYAWVLDETGEERHRGITMDVAQQVFETKTKVINLLDAPGHRDFIPNMITGAAQVNLTPCLCVHTSSG